jgi:peptidoglycan/LPS O-acetylase OafA/YrhL
LGKIAASVAPWLTGSKIAFRLEDCLEDRNNNCTLIRLCAALLVLFGHSWPLVHGVTSHDPLSEISRSFLPWSLGLPGIAVSAFFLLSGLLITRSYLERNQLGAFLEARALRIYPALIACVLVCVFLLGLLQTKLPVDSYLTNKATLNYLSHNTSLIFNIKYRLPGLFDELPFKGINGNLWTLPYEIWMYAVTALLGLLTVLRRQMLFNCTAAAVVIIYMLGLWPEDFTWNALERLGVFFLIGAFFFVNKRHIWLSPLVVAILLTATVASYGSSAFNPTCVLFLAYLLIFAAFYPPLNLPSVDRYGDISYGIYLYSFPIQQTLINQLQLSSPWTLFFCSFPFVVACAIISWILVEKPMLAQKGKMSILIGRYKPRLTGLLFPARE